MFSLKSFHDMWIKSYEENPIIEPGIPVFAIPAMPRSISTPPFISPRETGELVYRSRLSRLNKIKNDVTMIAKMILPNRLFAIDYNHTIQWNSIKPFDCYIRIFVDHEANTSNNRMFIQRRMMQNSVKWKIPIMRGAIVQTGDMRGIRIKIVFEELNKAAVLHLLDTIPSITVKETIRLNRVILEQS
jgi:hypothetical protein